MNSRCLLLFWYFKIKIMVILYQIVNLISPVEDKHIKIIKPQNTSRTLSEQVNVIAEADEL